MRPALEVADIFRRHGPAYRLIHYGHLGRVERRVMSAIEICRTPALGGHVEACDDCGHSRIAYTALYPARLQGTVFVGAPNSPAGSAALCALRQFQYLGFCPEFSGAGILQRDIIALIQSQTRHFDRF